jgi:hypothetical protein
MAEDYVVVDIGLYSQTGMKRHREKTRRENAQWMVFNNTTTSVFVEYFRAMPFFSTKRAKGNSKGAPTGTN